MEEKSGKTQGRPSRYSSDHDRQAYNLALLGATDADLARAFGVVEKTINNWKLKHPSFLQALKSGKDEADANVSQSLYRRALGYSHPDVHISSYMGQVIETPITKHYPPDTTACIFWLKNRRPQDWRDRHHMEHSGAVDGNVGVTVYMPDNGRDNADDK